MSDTLAPANELEAPAPKPRKARASVPSVPAQPIRFSANCLIGGTGLELEPGTRIVIEGSAANDGIFTVIEKPGHNDRYWLAVQPHVKDERPSPSATVTVLD